MSQKLLNHSFTLNNKKISYSLRSIGKEKTWFECEEANIAQEFLNEDIPALLIDLPNLVLAERDYKKSNSEVLRFRISVEDKEKIFKKAAEEGYVSISSFLRDLALKA